MTLGNQSLHHWCGNKPVIIFSFTWTDELITFSEPQVYDPHVPHAAFFPTGGNQRTFAELSIAFLFSYFPANLGQLTPMSWSHQSLTSSFPPLTPTLTTAPASAAGDPGSQDNSAPGSPKVTSTLIRETAPIIHQLLCWSQDMQIEDVFSQEVGPWYDQEH
jgi:hypothetical protein